MRIEHASKQSFSKVTSGSRKDTNIHPIDEKNIVLINGHSPIISDDNTWMIYDDEKQEYVDTGIHVRDGEETDPTVPLWAKEQTKPIYTPEEIGAVNDGDVLTLGEIEQMFL